MKTKSSNASKNQANHQIVDMSTIKEFKDIKILFENQSEGESEGENQNIKCENLIKQPTFTQLQPMTFEKINEKNEENATKEEDDVIDREMKSLQTLICTEIKISVQEIESDEIIIRSLIDNMSCRVKTLINSTKPLLKLKLIPAKASNSNEDESEEATKKTATIDFNTQTEEFDMISYRDISIFTGDLLSYSPYKNKIRCIDINTIKNTIKISEGEYELANSSQAKQDDTFVFLSRTKLQEALLFQNNISVALQNKEGSTDTIAKMKASFTVLNEIYYQLIRICMDLEKEVAAYESKKELSDLIKLNSKIIDNVNQYYANGWKQGYGRGFQRGFQLGQFKGTCESKDIYHQKGFYEGICDGWQLGFDKGYRNAMKKVSEVASFYNIDLASLGIDADIKSNDLVKKAQQDIYDKIFKLSQKPSKIRAYLLLDKFHEYTEIKKQRLTKISRRNVSRLAYNLLTHFSQRNKDDEDILEFLYYQSRKVYVVQSLAERRMMNILCSISTYSSSDSTSLLFSKLLCITEQGYSKTITSHIAKFIMLCKQYTDEFSIDDYELPTAKIYEYAISSMPDLSQQSQLNFREKLFGQNPHAVNAFTACCSIVDYIYETTYSDGNKFLNWFNATTLMNRNYITLNEFCTLVFALKIYTLTFKMGTSSCSFTLNTILPQLKKYFCIRYKGKFVMHYKDIELIAKYTSLFDSEYCLNLYNSMPNQQSLHTYVPATIEKLRTVISEFAHFNTDYVDTPEEWKQRFDYLKIHYVKYHPMLIISILHIWSKGLESVKARLSEEMVRTQHVNEDIDVNDGSNIVNKIIEEKRYTVSH